MFLNLNRLLIIKYISFFFLFLFRENKNKKSKLHIHYFRLGSFVHILCLVQKIPPQKYVF